jgi:hypothetical protein
MFLYSFLEGLCWGGGPTFFVILFGSKSHNMPSDNTIFFPSNSSFSEGKGGKANFF